MYSPRLIAFTFCAVAALPARAADVVQTGHTTQTITFTTDIFKMIDDDSLVIAFAPGSKTLTEASQTSIGKFAKMTNDEGKVEKVIVAAWSDKDYPQANEKRTKADAALASDRGEAIQKALKAAKASSVATYNMAEKPSWLAKEFDTKGDLLKTGGTGATSADQLYRQIGDRLRSKGGPGKAVLIAKFKNEVVTN